MKSSKNVQSTNTFAKLIWSNVLRQQYLYGISDKQLSDVMGVTTRTLYNYRHDPSSVTVKQLQAVIESFGMEPETLFQA